METDSTPKCRWCRHRLIRIVHVAGPMDFCLACDHGIDAPVVQEITAGHRAALEELVERMRHR